jgi:tRNA (cmo5U34)-methyltransferase
MKEFSFKNFANEFDEHINDSIRGYSDLLNDIVNLSSFCIDDNSNVVDIGSSTGKALKEIAECNKKKSGVNYIGVEIESEFSKFYEQSPEINFCNKDINSCEFTNVSFAYSLFTMQFLSRKDQREAISKIYNWLSHDGSFILAEKVDMDDSSVNEMLQNLIVEHKMKNFTPEEILSKDYSLRFIMRRRKYQENIKLLYSVGFSTVEPIWQNHRFVAFFAKK